MAWCGGWEGGGVVGVVWGWFWGGVGWFFLAPAGCQRRIRSPGPVPVRKG